MLVIALLPAAAVALVLTDSVAAADPSAIDLGSASDASVLAGSGVTNTGPTAVNLDVDSYPTAAITGFPPGVTSGVEHAADSTAETAQSDLATAYAAAVATPPTTDVTGQDLGGMTLGAGVYHAAVSMTIDGPAPLTLQGGATSVFIFQAGSTLLAGSNSSVVLGTGVQACNVFWQVGTSATIGLGAIFAGNVLASTSITLDTGASIAGRALAENGAVTLDDNAVTSSTCAGSPATTVAPVTTTTVAPTTTIPPTTIAPTTSLPVSTTILSPTTVSPPVATTSPPTTTVAASTTSVAASTSTASVPIVGPVNSVTPTTPGAPTTTSPAPVTTPAATTTSVVRALAGGHPSGGSGGGLASTGIPLRRGVEVSATLLVAGGAAVLGARYRRRPGG
jgi:hypothetical protein